MDGRNPRRSALLRRGFLRRRPLPAASLILSAAVALGRARPAGIETEPRAPARSAQPGWRLDTSQAAEQAGSDPRAAPGDDALSGSTLGHVVTERPVFGKAGSRRWFIQGAFADDTTDDRLALVGVGIDKFIADGLSLDVALNLMVVNQDGGNAVGVNGTLLMTWHFVRERTWSAFLNAGAGLLWTTADVPSDGSSFNFTPQVGGGVTLLVDPGTDTRLVLGIGWEHISNAQTFSTNPGRDSIMGYAALSFPF